MAKTPPNERDSSASLGFEAKLWLTADKLRNNMDVAEYKHVVLGLIFLKYISDTFEEHRVKLLAGQGDYEGANPEDPDKYKAENVFWVPADARWPHLQAAAKQPAIGTADIAAHGHVLTPGRYVGAEEVKDDGEPFEEKMPHLVAELHAQFEESAKLEQAITANLKGLGYGN